MKNENELDQLFKKGLEDPEIPFNELAWKKMADKLDANVPKNAGQLWPYATAGIAATLLLLLFWFLSENHLSTKNKRNDNVKIKAKPSTKAPEPNSEAMEAPVAKTKRPDPKNAPPSITTLREAEGTTPALTSLPETRADETPLLADVKMPQLLTHDLPGIPIPAMSLTVPNIASAISIVNNPKEDEENAIKRIENTNVGKLVLTLLAAPDITNTTSSIGNKVSSNFGLLLSYPLSQKLSVSSGAIYARKLYDYGGTGPSVYGKAGAPWEIDGTCFVLDVPLNLNYQVLKKKNISISVNSGLSSYFMLKEKYKYSYAEPGGNLNVSGIEINNQNQHILGVANFSITFEHKVGRNLSIGLQPFYKVPLTGIGLYDINLKSKGMAVSISASPFKRKK